jgi:hypothetical protein
MKYLSTLKGRLMALALSVSCFVLAFAGTASAALKVEAKDFTEPVEGSLGEAVPVVVGFVAIVFAVGFVIGWILKRARAAKS